MLTLLAQAPNGGGTDLTQYGPWGVAVAFLMGICGKLYADNNRLHKEKDEQTTSYLVVFTQVGNMLPELATLVRDMLARKDDPQVTVARIDQIDNRVALVETLVREGQTKIQAEIRSLARRRAAS